MNAKKCSALLLAATLLMTMVSCFAGGENSSSKSASEAPVEKKDPNWPVAVGEIRLEKQPETVVSLSPALTEVIYELGGEKQLKGVSNHCDYPESVTGLPACGTAALPDRAVLEKLAPQVVFSSAPLTQEDTVWLQQQGAEVIVLPRVQNAEALEETYRTVGMALGGMIDGKADGEAVFAPLLEQYQQMTAAAGRIEKPFSGLWLRMTPLVAATGDTFEGQLLEAMGVKNAAAEFTGWEYPADKAADLYPDLIFYDQSIDPEYFGSTQVYSTTEAFKQKRLYPFNALVIERQSGRMFTELERMFAAAYPDAALASLEPLEMPEEPQSTGEGAAATSSEGVSAAQDVQLEESPQ